MRIDVSSYFKNEKNLYLCKCPKTQYRFFFPNFTGDSKLYKQLSVHPWYYKKHKWEHEIGAKYLKNNHVSLELGCGKGDFLGSVSSLCSECHGIEITVDKSNVNSYNNVKIFENRIEEHNKRYPEYYDIIYSFQVLEHVHNVNSFVLNTLKALKPGGLLIVGVPNNNSPVIKHDTFNPLNYPPHHTGLWNKKSLKNISKVFDIIPVSFYYEPFLKTKAKALYNILIKKLIVCCPMLGKTIDKLFWRNGHLFIRPFSHFIRSHTILCVYKKPKP